MAMVVMAIGLSEEKEKKALPVIQKLHVHTCIPSIEITEGLLYNVQGLS